ncbi:hypothetical protein KAS50_08605, partial [bacterium]|nr:hypothetical protein [bacterium]
MADYSLDVLDNIWHALWAYDNLFTNFTQMFHGNILYPAKYTFLFTDHMLGTMIFFMPFYSLTKNPVFAHNMVNLFQTILAGVSMYALSYYWTRRKLPSFYAGFIFAFSPALLNDTPNLSICIAPLYILFLHKYLKDNKLIYGITSALIFSYIALSSIYIGYFIAFITLVYITGYLLKINKTFKANFYIKSVICLILLIIIVLPFRMPYINLKKEYGHKRSLGEMMQHSADPIASYISGRSRLYDQSYRDIMIESVLPGEEWIFQKAVPLLKNKFPTGIEKLPGETAEEKIPYSRFLSIMKGGRKGAFFFGILPLLLAFFGIIFMKKYNQQKLKNIRVLFLAILITFYILSLGPVLTILGHMTYIPLPDLLLYYIVPGFNALRRVTDFGFVVFMILAFFTGFGILYLDDILTRRYKLSNKIKILIFALVFLITTAEIIKMPLTERQIKIKTNREIPEVYQWLTNNNIDGAVAELPTVKGNYNKYDPVHGKNRSRYAAREFEYMY